MEGWVDLSTAVKVCTARAQDCISQQPSEINTTFSGVIRTWILSHRSQAVRLANHWLLRPAHGTNDHIKSEWMNKWMNGCFHVQHCSVWPRQPNIPGLSTNSNCPATGGQPLNTVAQSHWWGILITSCDPHTKTTWYSAGGGNSGTDADVLCWHLANYCVKKL